MRECENTGHEPSNPRSSTFVNQKDNRAKVPFLVTGSKKKAHKMEIHDLANRRSRPNKLNKTPPLKSIGKESSFEIDGKQITLTEQGGPVSRKTTKHIHHLKAGLWTETEDLLWQRPSPSHYPLAWLRTYLIKTFTEGLVAKCYKI